MIAKNKGGRPRAFKNVEEMRPIIDKYFFDCDNNIKVVKNDKGDTRAIYEPYTVSGLCLALDVDKSTLSEYEKMPEFSYTIKSAKQKIENWLEKRSLMGDTNPTVSIFNLKNNFGWTDKIETENKNTNHNTHEVSINVIPKK